jgi:hypothetical protein
MCNLFCFIRYASERRDDTCNPNIRLFAQPACEPRVNAGAPRPPRNCRKWSFQGGGGACRGGGSGGGTAKVAREPPGESTQMRAGGATEAIWVDSARRSRGFARGCGRERVPLMYRTSGSIPVVPPPPPESPKMVVPGENGRQARQSTFFSSR